jgi:uncharacterized protein
MRREDFDTLAPEFRIQVNSQDLPLTAKADLINATVLSDVDRPAMFTMTMHGWDGVEMKPKWIDDDLFKEGNVIELRMGYRDHLKSLFKGEITGLEPEFLEGQPPTFGVRGYDRRHRLMRSHKTRTFTHVKDSDLAREIAGEAGLTPEVDDSGVTHPYMIQHNQTDLDFLTSRARRIGFEIMVDDRTLIFRRRRQGDAGTITLRREVELLEFLPRLSTIGISEEIEVRGWDFKNKREFVARATAADESRVMGGATLGPSTVQSAFPSTISVTVDVPFQSQEEADGVAKGLLAEMSLEYIQAEGVCIGNPELNVGTVVKIEGVGRRFSGLYYLTSTEHRYQSNKGYRTLFTAKRSAT